MIEDEVATYQDEIEELQSEVDSLRNRLSDVEWDADGYQTDLYEREYELEELRKETDKKSFGYVAQEIWETCDEKGFHEPVDIAVLNKALRLILVVGEISEALEAMRKGDEENHHEEIADAMIRLLHYGACEGIDMDAEIQRKMEINRGRPYKHGKKF